MVWITKICLGYWMQRWACHTLCSSWLQPQTNCWNWHWSQTDSNCTQEHQNVFKFPSKWTPVPNFHATHVWVHPKDEFLCLFIPLSRQRFIRSRELCTGKWWIPSNGPARIWRYTLSFGHKMGPPKLERCRPQTFLSENFCSFATRRKIDTWSARLGLIQQEKKTNREFKHWCFCYF